MTGESDTAMARSWARALEGMTLRHPDPSADVTVELRAGVVLELAIAVRVRSTCDQSQWFDPLNISTVRLDCWPGEALAQSWLAAGWAGYIQHEALELATRADGSRPLDPHADPFHADRGLRDGLPPVLTLASLERAIAVVMTETNARALVASLQPVSQPTPRRHVPSTSAFAPNSI